MGLHFTFYDMAVFVLCAILVATIFHCIRRKKHKTAMVVSMLTVAIGITNPIRIIVETEAHNKRADASIEEAQRKLVENLPPKVSKGIPAYSDYLKSKTGD